MQTKRFADVNWAELAPGELQSIQAKVTAALKGARPQPKGEVPGVLKDGERYKASLAKVVPAQAKDTFAQHRRCMLGCSLGSKNSEGAPLEGTLRWIAESFDSCAVLVGDSVYRLTLQLTRNLDPEASIPAGLQAGREFIAKHREMIETVARSSRCRFEILPLSEVEKSPDFRPFHEQLRALYRAEEPFRKTVDGFADIYLGRGEQGTAGGDAAKKAAIATDYLLEESALFACLVKQGIDVFVYPGSIKSFEDIVEGAYPGVPEELKRVIFASVRLKRGGAHFINAAAAGPGSEELEPESHALLADLPEAGWGRLTAHTDTVRVPAGTTIVKHGESDRALYILTEGRLEIVVPDGRRVAMVDPGSVFGEQAFIDASPRSASVVAVNDCAALRLSQEGLEQLRASEPEIAYQLLLDIARVLSQRLRSRA